MLSAIARDYAERHWVNMSAREPSEAAATVARMLYCSWGMTAVRAQASLKLDGLAYVGTGAAAASRRRSAASAWHFRAREAYQLHHAGAQLRTKL